MGKAAPPPTMEDTWEEVKDETTGQTYWWNVQTNETTALGAPKPVATSLTPAQQGGAPPPVGQPPQQRSMMGAFGSMVAEGMAFGTGSAIAHRAIGSMFGGGGYGYGGGMGGGGGVEPLRRSRAAVPRFRRRERAGRRCGAMSSTRTPIALTEAAGETCSTDGMSRVSARLFFFAKTLYTLLSHAVEVKTSIGYNAGSVQSKPSAPFFSG